MTPEQRAEIMAELEVVLKKHRVQLLPVVILRSGDAVRPSDLYDPPPGSREGYTLVELLPEAEVK